jgi:hypothetical protein
MRDPASDFTRNQNAPARINAAHAKSNRLQRFE